MFEEIRGSTQVCWPRDTALEHSAKHSTAKPPKRGRYPDLELPHITIQMPVYKEGLKG